ncbi:MAG: glycosyltransferase family 9 protein [Candidatus Aminicenantes bacterium]|nr:MAG: glycosyltransferase family 9 protein [Candidatus Aminicenantes bacterium]
MNIDFMRLIDRRFGVPICFFLSCVHRLRRIFSKPVLIKNPGKILFIELSEMGSMVLAYPLFEKTKELFPGAKLYFLTFKESRYTIDVLDVLPHENVITINNSNFFAFLLTTINALWKLRKEKISIAIDMELFARFTSILSYLSSAKNRVGYFRFHSEGLYRGNLLTHKVAFNPHIHISHNLLNLIYAVISPQQDVPFTKKVVEKKDIIVPRLKVSESAWDKILAKLGKENEDITKAGAIILLNPNASDIIPIRRWPLENYVELAKLLLSHKDVYIVITGTSKERRDADVVCEAVDSERCINFAGKTTFSELMDLYSISDILITNDSGPVHFSAMTDIKTFVFFGPETPLLYGPLAENCHVFYSDYACSPCVSAFNNRKSACKDNRCLKSISVTEVYSKVKKSLSSKD